MSQTETVRKEEKKILKNTVVLHNAYPQSAMWPLISDPKGKYK